MVLKNITVSYVAVGYGKLQYIVVYAMYHHLYSAQFSRQNTAKESMSGHSFDANGYSWPDPRDPTENG